MTEINCEHYSHCFKLKMKTLPVKATDRFSRVILLVAIVFGAMLCMLSILYFMPDLINGNADIERGIPKIHSRIDTMIAPQVFNIIIFLTGVAIIVVSLVKFFNYKKIRFDGDMFTVKHHPFGRPKTIFSEELYNYLGVRLRVKFYQFGIFNQNKYIIELFHRDPSKIIPLYISTNKRDIRRIWKQYAQALHMPGITISDKGMVSHNFNDLDRSYAEVAAEWHLPKDFVYRQEKPFYMMCKSNKAGEKMIKINKLFLDAYSFLSIMTIGLLSALLVYAGISYDVLLEHLSMVTIWALGGILIIVILYALAHLISTDIIFLAHQKVYIFRKIAFIRLRDAIIPIQQIKGIDINYTPTSERYYLNISTAEQNYQVAYKLPVSGLRWLRGILIHEIIGN